MIYRYTKLEGFDPQLFLGIRKKRGEQFYTIEDNKFNQMVLGEFPEYSFEQDKLVHSESLFGYQRPDVMRMCNSDRIINANRMGYGKTVETIAAMRELGVQNAVIICPSSIKLQWRNLLLKWYPEIDASRVVVFDSKTYPVTENTFVILNYEKLLNATVCMSLRRWQWDVLVCDEVHRLKNRRSKRSVAAKQIPAARIWGLTGTPILNRPDDLWSILHLLGEEYSGISYWNFVNFFCNVVETPFGKKIDGLSHDSRKVDLLNQYLKRVFIINPEMQVTRGRVHTTIPLQMGSKQKKLYRDTKNILLDELPENLTIPNGAVLCIRVMQITSNPSMYLQGVAGVKFEYIRDLLADNPNEKFVIFSKFATTCKALQDYLEYKTVLYTGDLTEDEKASNKNAFMHDNNCRAIIGTIAAMSEGVDGLQYASHIAVFIERDWSPEIMKQAEARLDRFGQQHKVQIIQLECIGTYDKHVGKVNLSKSEDIRRALNDEDSIS